MQYFTLGSCCVPLSWVSSRDRAVSLLTVGGHPEGKEFLSDLSSLHTGVFETKLQVICLGSCASGLGYIVLNYRVGHSHGQCFLWVSAICIPWPALISVLRHYLIVAIIGPCFAYVSYSCHLLLLLKSFVFSLLFMCLCLLYVCVGGCILATVLVCGSEDSLWELGFYLWYSGSRHWVRLLGTKYLYLWAFLPGPRFLSAVGGQPNPLSSLLSLGPA